MLIPAALKKKAILRCLSMDGRVRYELPAVFFGSIPGYFVYLRPDPVIIHHLKNQIFKLNYPEIVLVSIAEQHCISIGFDGQGYAKNMYVNINLVPQAYKQGHQWHDLELDVIFAQSYEDKLSPYVVDFDEFDESSLSDELKEIAKTEAATVIQRALSKALPFSLCNQKWLGLDLCSYFIPKIA